MVGSQASTLFPIWEKFLIVVKRYDLCFYQLDISAQDLQNVQK
jgi:hypothetical protein